MGTRAAGGRRPQGFRSLSLKVFIRPLSNLVNMLVGIISRPSSITRHFWIMALELSKNWLSSICSPSRISCSQKCCHYHWTYHKYDVRILCPFGTLVLLLHFYYFSPKTVFVSWNFVIPFEMLFHLVYLTYRKVCDSLKCHLDTDIASLNPSKVSIIIFVLKVYYVNSCHLTSSANFESLITVLFRTSVVNINYNYIYKCIVTMFKVKHSANRTIIY